MLIYSMPKNFFEKFLTDFFKNVSRMKQGCCFLRGVRTGVPI